MVGRAAICLSSVLLDFFQEVADQILGGGGEFVFLCQQILGRRSGENEGVGNFLVRFVPECFAGDDVGGQSLAGRGGDVGAINLLNICRY